MHVHCTHTRARAHTNSQAQTLARAHTHTLAHTHTHSHTHTLAHKHTRTHKHSRTHTHTHSRTHTLTHTHTHTLTHTHTQTHTHTHKHPYTRARAITNISLYACAQMTGPTVTQQVMKLALTKTSTFYCSSLWSLPIRLYLKTVLLLSSVWTVNCTQNSVPRDRCVASDVSF